METFKIKDLVIGQSAVIIGYEAGDQSYKSKLLSLGLTKNTVVKLIKVAPLGDPIELEVRGFHLSLRKDEAGVILLKNA
ncbi:MAG: ferrous iron transport protein A [Spirochaetales bacterium]|jgi:ferrous iron transport protein A|nr:ferrous iron transport protein A [Spirochaetales bacterium]